MERGMQLSILVSGQVMHSAVCVQMLHGTITQTTEKAIKVKSTDLCAEKILDREVWLPRKAIVPFGPNFKLAPWFRPEGYTSWVLENCNVAGVSSSQA